MIAPLRRRHRWLAPVCFLGAAAGLVLGVIARPSAFIAEGTGGASLPATPAGVDAAAHPISEVDGLRAAIVQDPGGVNRSLWIVADIRLEASDVLAYLSAELATESLPSNARLIGPVAPLGATRLSLPDGDWTALTVFSLGQQRVLGSVRLGDLRAEVR